MVLGGVRGRIWSLAVTALFAIVLLAPGAAQAASKDVKARAAVARVAADVSNARLPKTDAQRLRKALRAGARSVRGKRRACAAVGAVLDAGLTGRKARRGKRRLLRDVTKAERALQALKATRQCAPRVRHIKVRSVTPQFNAGVPKGPDVHEQGGADEYTVPADPRRNPVAPQAPETAVGTAAPGGVFSAGVTDPLQILTTTDLGPAPCCSYPQEPQVAKAGDVVLLSGNTAGFLSTDGGGSFVPVDATRVFGTAGQQPICCDTVVRYVPRIDRFVWLMQYWCDQPNAGCDGATQNNRYRLAVISPQALRDNRSDPTRGWTVFDFTTQQFRSSSWFDYPDMAVGRDNLYLTWDVVGVGTINSRVPLSQLTRPGTLDVAWFPGSDIFYRLAQNPSTTAFYVKNSTDSVAEAYLWNDVLPFPLSVGLPHATVPWHNFTHFTPSGQNWTDRVGSGAVKGATLRTSELWVAWTAGRSYSEAGGSPSYPLPHIQLAAFDTTDILHALFTGQLRKIRDQYIWNSTTAYADPVLATNSDDDVGITFAFATGNSQPAPAVGILTNSGFTQRAALSEAPAVAVQGDYAGLQPDFPDATRFVAANTFNPRANNEDWLFTRFGRAPRTSPPAGRTPTGIRITRATGTQFDCCFTGDTVQVTGLLEGAPAGSAVRLEYTAPTGSSVPTVQNVTADEAGNFHGSFAASQNGTWRVVAVYAGDSQHDPSTSDPFFVSVQNPPG